MAPTKNPNTTCNSNTPNSSGVSGGTTDSNDGVPASSSTGGGKKQTGTVPKATAPVLRMERDTSQINTKVPTTNYVAISSGRTSKSTTKRSAATLIQQQPQQLQHQQQQQQSLTNSVFASERASPLSIVTATQHQQQAQQQLQQRKNTEIVAPIRRDLKDLNDYLLSTVVTTTNNNNNSNNQQQLYAPQQHQLKQHNYSKSQLQHQQQQQQQQLNDNNPTNSSGFDIETITDNQSRFCYPVRPIPRRNLQQNDTNDFNTSYSNSTASNLNQLNPSAAVGVVIPTTPGILNNNSSNNNINPLATTNEDIATIINATNNFLPNSLRTSINSNTAINQQQLLLLQQLQQQIEEQQSSLLATNKQQTAAHLLDLATSTLSTTTPSNDINLLQRLQLIQQILSLNSKTNSAPTVAVASSNLIPQLNRTQNTKMVNGVNSPDRDIIVNSDSLEDVALSELSDNRAQSITSLHSAIETPTPDNAPTYDELQQRLEASNRNIQNMQEQQQQLIRLQNQAKQHLSEMESLRQQTAPLSFGQQNGNGVNGTDAPEYQSIEQVHSDMASLVGRMKNLTTFIQNQNELGNLLGDDGPDILAEQEALQRKLESLRTQRDEMRSLVGELQDINRSAEKSAAERRQGTTERKEEDTRRNNYTSANAPAPPPTASSTAAAARIVPVEYSRIVPIEMLQAAAAGGNRVKQNDVAAISPHNNVEEVDPAESELIRQKVADIEAMKAQLKRLKDMMETVNLIEEHTANRPDPKAIGRSATVVEIPVQRERTSASNRSSYDRERTPTAGSQDNDEFISARVRMLNDVTCDLRAQAMNLQAERDRIKALKDEIVRRKEQAAAAAQMGEDALKRNSLTPTPQLQKKAEEQVERDLLKEEYEVKKKEFEQLCQRLQNEDNCTSTPTALRAGLRTDIVSEADDEAEEEVNDSDFAAEAAAGKYYTGVTLQSHNSSANEAKNVTATTTATATSLNERRGKDSIDSSTAAVNTTHDTAASLEAASMQSGSSQSYSMPPPMQQLGSTAGWLPGPIPPPLPTSWNPHFYYGSSHPPAASFTPPHFTGMHGVGPTQHPPPPPSSTECICSASNSATTLGATSATAPAVGSASAAQLVADPMLLQQFVQTQQMLINSVCQCNQMLWHQQREIDALNNTIHILQDRLLTLAGPSTADLAFNIRAESVPPPSTLSGSLPINNNIYASIQNRAQSEQPLTFMPTPRGGSAAYANFHQQQQLQQQQHLFHQRQRSAMNTVGGYNYAAETQHQNASSASTSIYSTLNNAAPPPPPPPQFNNEAPQSPMSGAGPGPIFMHHHNNSIHQNNANLRTQNQHANNLQQQQHQHSNLAGSNTLNNQVPPGNRANNYWDNFRSYSRQNLLSTNSNKSNEDQNQQHLQQIDQQYQPQAPHTLSSLSQEQQPQLYEQRQINVGNDCNNLNYDNSNNTGSNNNSMSCNKYLRSLQRSRINQLQQQQQQQCQSVENMLPTTTNSGNIFQPNVPSRELLENLNWHNTDIVDNIYDNYNITLNDMSSATYNAPTVATSAAAAATQARNMNMNLNFGNNAQYQRNKVPAKPTCRGAVTLNRNISSLQLPRQQQQQQYQNQRYNLLQQTAPPPPPPPSAAAIGTTLIRNSHNRNREREQDFLLCTVDMTDGYNYVDTPTGELVQQHGVPDEFTDNIAPVDDDEDDTTSEEIKRNLLVNALKNDKFTTKFYESIKEDVFRRLESLLLEKETTERSHSSSSSQQQQHQQQFLTQLFNDVGSGVATGSNVDASISSVARDPTRKLYLNAQMGNQLQQQQLQEQQEYEPTLAHLKLEIDADEYDNNNAEETESNNADNDVTPLGKTISNTGFDVANLESEEPEENENQGQNRSVEIATTNSSIVTNNEVQKIRSTSCEHVCMDLAKNVSNGTAKKRKNQRQRNNLNVIDASMSGACALLADDQQGGHIVSNNNNGLEINQNPPDHELINYIIARIHNQTQASTIINDTLLVEIAKLTATAAQNCATLTDNMAMQQQSPQPTLSQNISPKKIYAKIKKLGIPRQRDQFLVWYQDYLETLFIINNKHAINVKKQQQQNTRNKKTQQVEMTNEKITNNTNAQAKQPKMQNLSSTTTATNHNNNILENVGNLEVNDADLAEADQICSANTSSNNSTLLLSSDDLTDTNVVSKEQHVVELKEENNFDMNLNTATKQQQHLKNEYDELENNENPEEEGAGGACNNLTEKQSNLNEKEVNDAEEDEEEEETSVIAVVSAMPGNGAETTTNFNLNLQHLDALTISSNSDENNTTRTQKEFAKRNSLA